MIIYVNDALDGLMMLELSSSATLTDVKKKIAEKGGRTDKNTKYIANGKAVSGSQRLRDQGVKAGSTLYPVHLRIN